DDGKVWYRSPGVFSEYYKEPEKTAETKDPEGWVDTGDAGFIGLAGSYRSVSGNHRLGRRQ
ncbi:MAG: hypothetical protein AAF385_11420, partial [Pseudomonadota bacterium]